MYMRFHRTGQTLLPLGIVLVYNDFCKRDVKRSTDLREIIRAAQHQILEKHLKSWGMQSFCFCLSCFFNNTLCRPRVGNFRRVRAKCAALKAMMSHPMPASRHLTLSSENKNKGMHQSRKCRHLDLQQTSSKSSKSGMIESILADPSADHRAGRTV